MSPISTVKDVVKKTGWKNLGIFLFILVVALANWGLTNDIKTVQELLTLPNIFSMIVVMGTIGSAYGLKPPTK